MDLEQEVCVPGDFTDAVENNGAFGSINIEEQVLAFFFEHGGVHFSEIENRSFEVSMLDNFDEAYYEIVVQGILSDGGTYHIDTFIVNRDSRSFYVYHNKSGQYLKYGWSMSYRSATSPIWSYRLEHGGAGNRSLEQGLIYSGILRIICLHTGSVLWNLDEDIFFRAHRIFWSECERFVALDNPWIWYTDVMIIDTTDFSETNLIGVTGIVDAVSEATNHDFCMSFGSDHHHTLIGWVDDSTLEVEFYWLTTEATIVRGTYQFNIITGTVIDIAIFDDE